MHRAGRKPLRRTRHQNTSLWLSRAAAAALTAAATFTGLSVVSAPTADAGTCTEPACGRVWNWTNSTMRIAELEAEHQERCTVRTWSSKEEVTDYKNDGKIACRTKSLGSDEYSGDKMKDTDAFTFNRKFSLDGVSYSAGTYVKINDLANVACVNPVDTMPRCSF